MMFQKLTKYKKIIWLLVLWQVLCVALMSAGVWPYWLVYLNLGLFGVFLLWAPVYESILLLVISIPFFVAIPNHYFPALANWRFLFIALFLVWLIKEFGRQFPALRALPFKQKLLKIESLFLPWDKYIALFILISIISMFFAPYPFQAFKFVSFLLNAYLLYIVILNIVKTKQQLCQLIYYSAISLSLIVLIGYGQFILSLFVDPYYFWQYWATMISRLYYGLDLANVLVYSNSWFAYSGDSSSLRMFSIMPDSHSFAMIAALFIAFALPFTTNKKSLKPNRSKLYCTLTSPSYYLWVLIRFAGLAVILSGTRGMWVGMLGAFIVAIFFFIRKFARPLMKKAIWPMLMIILFFVLSPFINQGLNMVRIYKFQENFLERAASIYDIGEESNAGRLIIWKHSLNFALTHPFGIGAGNFIVSLIDEVKPGTSFEQLGQEKNLRYNLPQKFVTAHSLYLNLLVELGLAGLLAFALFVWEYLIQAYRFIKKHGHDYNLQTLFVANGALTFIWFLGYGVFDITLFNDKVLIYCLISLAISGVIINRYQSFKEEL